MIVKQKQVLPLLAAACIAVSLYPIFLSGQTPLLSGTPTTKVSPVAPRREAVEAVVKEAYAKFKGETKGKNADYIPYLAHVDSKLFGIAIVTTDNQSLTMGDVKYSFSIQSISKVYT